MTLVQRHGLGVAVNDAPRADYLGTLERLLALETTVLQPAIEAACRVLVEAFNADKVDIMLYEPSSESLFAVGTGDTPMGRRQRAIGLDRQPIANGGRAVQVYRSGEPFSTGHADQDPIELAGMTQGLGIRSQIVVPLDIAGERRGIIAIAAAATDRFSDEDQMFLASVARWVGTIANQAELAEQIADRDRQQSRQMAADELVTAVAHELNNSLYAVKVQLTMLRQASQNLPITPIVQATGTAVEQVEAIVQNLLNSYRLEHGLFVLTPVMLDLVALAREVAASWQSDTVPVMVDAPATLRLSGDPAGLRQVLENLIANAVQQSPAGKSVTVTLARETLPGGEVATVTVSDQGRGIPPDVVPRLFRRFAAGPESRGLGLGLFLASEFARAHGGRLTLERTSRQGSRFLVALPNVAPDGG